MPPERLLTAALVGAGIAAALVAMIAATITGRGLDADGYARRRGVALAAVMATLVVAADVVEWLRRAGE